ncbi:hypothetical protein FRB94_006490 [Tulasnella sp. JGI-2019a]|nr:hypothetical protein FRB94_006490 [Tulasnella sp. JGI-2019a]
MPISAPVTTSTILKTSLTGGISTTMIVLIPIPGIPPPSPCVITLLCTPPPIVCVRFPLWYTRAFNGPSVPSQISNGWIGPPIICGKPSMLVVGATVAVAGSE